jgi:hypothetical protein
MRWVKEILVHRAPQGLSQEVMSESGRNKLVWGQGIILPLVALKLLVREEVIAETARWRALQ